VVDDSDMTGISYRFILLNVCADLASAISAFAKNEKEKMIFQNPSLPIEPG
jgi:hypothetical protein